MMIRIEAGEQCFSYRVAGVAIHDKSVLLHQGEGDDFWVLPGGRAELGEPAEQTLKREMNEEIGVDVEVVRLLWFVENFFSYAGKDCHEITLYFLMRLPVGCKYLVETGPFLGLETDEIKLVFEWFPRRAELLAALPLLPSFLPKALEKLPQSVQHVVHRIGFYPQCLSKIREESD